MAAMTVRSSSATDKIAKLPCGKPVEKIFDVKLW